jgi:hypothetical protein
MGGDENPEEEFKDEEDNDGKDQKPEDDPEDQ